MPLCWRSWATVLLLGITFASNVVAEEDYTLGIGDRVRMSVYGQEDLSIEAQISADGSINVPLVGPVRIGGLSATGAAKVISNLLERGDYLQNAHVNLLVTEYRSNTVAVLGQVNSPGRLTLERPTTLTEALALAGGMNERGSERIVLVRTDSDGQRVRQEYYLRELLDTQAESHPAVQLRRGDTLYVPRVDQFYVHGQVRSPGTYDIHRPLTVMQALSVSGGFSPGASTRGLVLYRKQEDGSVSEQKVSLQDPVRDGDVLFVKESLF